MYFHAATDIDGETLDLMRIQACAVEQYTSAGLKTLKQQIQFKKLLSPPEESSPSTASIPDSIVKTRKLTRKDIDTLDKTEKRMYLIRYEKIATCNLHVLLLSNL